MSINYLNKTSIQTPGGAASTGGSLALQGLAVTMGLISLFSIGRKKRDAPNTNHAHAHDEGDNSLVRDVLMKVCDGSGGGGG